MFGITHHRAACASDNRLTIQTVAFSYPSANTSAQYYQHQLTPLLVALTPHMRIMSLALCNRKPCYREHCNASCLHSKCASVIAVAAAEMHQAVEHLLTASSAWKRAAGVIWSVSLQATSHAISQLLLVERKYCIARCISCKQGRTTSTCIEHSCAALLVYLGSKLCSTVQ